MNKEDLVRKVAEKAQVSQKEAKKCLNAFIDVVREAISNNEKVVLVGFGSLEVVSRKEKTVKNPRTKELIKVPARKVVRFKAGKLLKEVLA
ncbi:MAG: HU family DNA-binding protein [Brevinematia bacterium]